MSLSVEFREIWQLPGNSSSLSKARPPHPQSDHHQALLTALEISPLLGPSFGSLLYLGSGPPWASLGTCSGSENTWTIVRVNPAMGAIHNFTLKNLFTPMYALGTSTHFSMKKWPQLPISQCCRAVPLLTSIRLVVWPG